MNAHGEQNTTPACPSAHVSLCHGTSCRAHIHESEDLEALLLYCGTVCCILPLSTESLIRKLFLLQCSILLGYSWGDGFFIPLQRRIL